MTEPAKTVLIRIGGIVMAVLGTVLFAYGVLLAVAFGGAEPLLWGIMRTPMIWVFLAIAASGLGLIIHARARDRRYRESRERAFPSS